MDLHSDFPSYGISPYSLCENGQSAILLHKNLCFFSREYESR
jgi:hypothetical protein